MNTSQNNAAAIHFIEPAPNNGPQHRFFTNEGPKMRVTYVAAVCRDGGGNVAAPQRDWEISVLDVNHNAKPGPPMKPFATPYAQPYAEIFPNGTDMDTGDALQFLWRAVGNYPKVHHFLVVGYYLP